MQSSPTLVLRNNLPTAVSLSLMNPNQAIPAFVNPSNAFFYNMICQGYLGTNRVSIQTKLNADANFVTVDALLSTPNLVNTAAALNTLGIGVFTAYSNADGVPFISVFSDTRTFGELNVFNSDDLEGFMDIEVQVTENNTGGAVITMNCDPLSDIIFPDIEVQHWGILFGGLVRMILTGGNNTNPSNYVVYTITKPNGDIIAQGPVAPGHTVNISFVIDMLPVGPNKYVINLLDAV